MAEDEINLSGRIIKLDVKMVLMGSGAILSFILWLTSISNKLDLLALQVATQSENRYTSNDAKRDFEIRDERFTNLRAEIVNLTSKLEAHSAKLSAMELPEDKRKIYSNKVP